MLRALETLTGENHDAADLAIAIDNAFWDGQDYRSFINTTLDSSASFQQDLLATSLATLDLGTRPEAIRTIHLVLMALPSYGLNSSTPIYHNRAIWPFVTAYSVLASRVANNSTTFKQV